MKAEDLCFGCVDETACVGAGTPNTNAVRWGFRFNDAGCCDWTTDLAVGGIGIKVNGASMIRYGAGNWHDCDGSGGTSCLESVATVEPTGAQIWGK